MQINFWPNTPYYVIWFFAFIFIIYFSVLFILNWKKKKAQIEAIKSRLKSTEVTEEQKRLLAFWAILFLHRFEKIYDLLPEWRIDMHVYWLKNWWWIENEFSAKSTISTLLNLEKSKEFDKFLFYENSDLQKIKKQIAKDLKKDISEIDTIKSTYAWDLTRAANLTKWCFWCSYLKEDEMWNYLEKISRIAEEKWENWDEYIISFLLGRTIQGFELYEVSAEANWLLKDDEIREEKNPYKIYKFKK